MTALAEAWVASQWWPASVPLPESLISPSTGDDLLPRLRDCTRERPESSLSQLHSWLSTTGARLTWSWPERPDRPWSAWLGSRLIWWPQGIPEGRKVAWVSSRLGRAIDERSDWFAVLRTAATKFDPEHDWLLTAPHTTTDRFLERAAMLFGLRLLRVELEERRSLTDWLSRLRRQLWRQCLLSIDRVEDSGTTELLESECASLSPVITANEHETDGTQRPLADRVLVAAADQVIALQVRPGGNLQDLLRRRLEDRAWPNGSVWLAWGDQLVPREVVEELQPLGAVSWHLRPQEVLAEQPLNPVTILQEGVFQAAEILLEPPWPAGEYLLHWTRRRNGSWPEQSADDFLDELLLTRGDTSHSAFAALARIARQKRLIGSSSGVRGGFRVVSFSATRLSELSNRRQFRVHRGRWDAEPFGLCVRRAWLEQLGARPVIYSDDSHWLTMNDADRPFFQLRHTRSRRGAAIIDWSAEAEWRALDDVDLATAGENNVALFVPSEAEARQLAEISPWPVVVVSRQKAENSRQ